MIYPKFLEEQKTIGIAAPSDGITDKIRQKRLNQAIKNIEQYSIKLKETSSTRKSNKGKSNTSQIQVKELQDLFNDNEVDTIISLTGGDFLIELLPLIDFKQIIKSPKWLQGYSDITSLLYILTTKYDIATIYANNFISFGMIPWHKSLQDNLEILKGNIVTQTNFDKYESISHLEITGTEPYRLDKKVNWKNLSSKKEFTITGRIIGGCLDVLSDLYGTPYDNTKEFLEKYKEDGIIWYFDVCELTSEQLIRTLFKWKVNNYFQYTKLILFGRIQEEKSYYHISYEEAIKRYLNDLDIKVIINVDIGHVAPRITIINGSLATITLKNNNATIKQELI